MLRRISSIASPDQDAALRESLALDMPGSVAWGGGIIGTVLEPEAPRDETVDLDCIVAPLSVRAPVPGDRFQPLGMSGRSTPLNDFFRGRDVTRQARRQTPLLCDKLGIVWVVGHRISERVKVTEADEPNAGPAVGTRRTRRDDFLFVKERFRLVEEAQGLLVAGVLGAYHGAKFSER